MSAFLALACCLSGALPQSAVAQAKPEELQNLRSGYFSRLAASNRTLTDQYIAALQRHERELGLSGNYDEAIRVAEKLDQVKQERQQMDSGTDGAQSDKIILRMSDARVSGGITYDQANGMLTNWVNSNAIANWSILRMQPGIYDVVVEYAVARSRSDFGGIRTGGGLLMRNVNTLRPDEETRIEFSVSSTGGPDSFRSVNVGTFEFTHSSANIRLETLRSNGGMIANIRSIEFLPLETARTDSATATPVTSAAENPSASEIREQLEKIRTSYRQRLERAVAPQIATYTQAISTLETRFRKSNHDTALKITRRELDAPLRRVGLPEDDQQNGEPPHDRHRLPGGFESLYGAKFLPHPDNTVDRFYLQHGEDIFQVRLYFVTGPVARSDQPETNRNIASYFGIPTAKANDLGRQGARFLEHCMEQHEFSVVTQWIADEEGLYYARVMLAGLGSLERALVSRGLVAIQGRMIDSDLMPGHAYVDSILREAEKTARQNRHGGWGMSEQLDNAFREANQTSTAE